MDTTFLIVISFYYIIKKVNMATGISRLFNEDSNAISSSRIMNYSLEIEGEEVDFQFTDCLLASGEFNHYESGENRQF